MNDAAKPGKPLRTLGILLVILGIALTGGGAWLMTRGASPYFVFVGAGLAATGVLLARAKKGALIAYGITFAIIVVGSLLEEGSNVQKLVPRLTLPVIIAIYLSRPAVWETLT